MSKLAEWGSVAGYALLLLAVMAVLALSEWLRKRDRKRRDRETVDAFLADLQRRREEGWPAEWRERWRP